MKAVDLQFLYFACAAGLCVCLLPESFSALFVVLVLVADGGGSE